MQHRYLVVFAVSLAAGAAVAKSATPRTGARTTATIPSSRLAAITLPTKNYRQIYSASIETRGGTDSVDDITSLSQRYPLRMSFLVKLHGVALLPFATVVLLESYGMEIPYIGCAASFAGWDTANPSLMAMTRLVAALSIGMGLTEMRYGDSVDMQSIWRIYHVPLVALTIHSSIEFAKGILGWFPATIFSAFFVASTHAKSMNPDFQQ